MTIKVLHLGMKYPAARCIPGLRNIEKMVKKVSRTDAGNTRATKRWMSWSTFVERIYD